MDVNYRYIPNWLSLSTAVAGLSLAAFSLFGESQVGSHSLHMLGALAAGIALYGLGVVGGGDAKYYAAVAAWFPLGQAVNLLISVTLCGLLLLVVWATYRRLKRYPVRHSGKSKFDFLPYGLAIGIGSVVAKVV